LSVFCLDGHHKGLLTSRRRLTTVLVSVDILLLVPPGACIRHDGERPRELALGERGVSLHLENVVSLCREVHFDGGASVEPACEGFLLSAFELCFKVKLLSFAPCLMSCCISTPAISLVTVRTLDSTRLVFEQRSASSSLSLIVL